MVLKEAVDRLVDKYGDQISMRNTTMMFAS
jgi:hypothetical protein